jgi:photosystem II stability/assembly factor-like uncharacterized protein
MKKRKRVRKQIHPKPVAVDKRRPGVKPPELILEPASVRQGDPIIVRGRGWEPVTVDLKIDGKSVRPARASAGAIAGAGVRPEPTGEFAIEIFTYDFEPGKHRITAASQHEIHADVVNHSLTVRERPCWDDAREELQKKHREGKIETGGAEDEGWDPPYWRQLHWFQRRFGHLRFIPEGTRETQIRSIRKLRDVRDRVRDRGRGGPGEPSQPVPGVCNWTPVGAGPLVVTPTIAYSGRVISIAFHPTDPAIIYAGAANGGVWKSTDNGQTWDPKSDYQHSLAIGALAIDSNNPQQIFAGTGQYGAAVGTFYGNGILRSIDGGNTWTELATAAFVRDEISRLLFDPTDAMSQNMFLSATTGVYASTDGGSNWTLLRAGAASDLVLLVNGADVQLIAGFAGSGIWTATRSGAIWSAWTQFASAAFPATFARIVLGQSKNNPQTIYAAFSDGHNIAGMAKTTTGGASWTRVTPPLSVDLTTTSLFAGAPSHTHDVTIPNADFAGAVGTTRVTTGPSTGPAHTHTITLTAAQVQTLAAGLGSVTVSTDPDATSHSHSFILNRRLSGQTWYNFHISPHPDDPNTVYYGEVSLWKTTTGDGPWAMLPIVHTDNHAFAFEPGNPQNIWATCDGGVYASTDGGASWSHRNRDLGTLEYISVSQHPQYETILIGGTQDNGTHRYTGSPAWEYSAGGDGGFTAIDPVTPSRMYHEYTGTTFYRSDSSGTPGSWMLKNSGVTGGSEFYAPFVLDPSNPNTCYFGGGQLWRSANNADTWSAITNALSGNITAIAVHPTDSNTIYVATTAGHVYLVQKIGPTWNVADVSTTDITGPNLPPNVYLSDLVVDSAGTVWVTLSSVLWSETTGEFSNDHVYRRLSGSTIWESRSSGLAQANPVNTIVIDPTNSLRLFCGADVGVFRTEDAGGSWVPWDEGIPNVAVFDLSIHGPRRLVRAATHGRSIWERPIDASSCPLVDLYMRDNILDSGRVQPTPEHVFHPFDPAFWVGHWQSEDVKVDGPEPTYQTPSPITNYVQFASLQHRSTRRNSTNRFYVQVHNRGVSIAHNVQVRAFFAAAASGLPPLPADFWSGGKPFTGTPSGPDWTAVGLARNLGDLEPAEPGLAEWDFFVPASAPQHSCILAVATCTEDPLSAAGIFDPDFLVLNRKQVTLKNLNVEDAVSGTAMPPEQAYLFEMRAPSPEQLLGNLRFRWGSLPRETKVFVAFSLDVDGEPAVQAKPAELRRLGISVGRDIGKLFPDTVEDMHGRVLRVDRRRVYQLKQDQGGVTLIPQIRMPLKAPLKAALNFILPARNEGAYQFDMVQLSGERVVGGVTYRVRALKPG